MGIKAKKVTLGKGVEVFEQIFENQPKNQTENRKMSRIMVELDLLTINDFIPWERKREKEICREKHN